MLVGVLNVGLYTIASENDRKYDGTGVVGSLEFAGFENRTNTFENGQICTERGSNFTNEH